MKQLDYMGLAEEAMAQIKKGAFLTVRVDDQVNTMTIGWATIGFCWRKPVFMVAVRDSRYTFSLIEKAPDFTVTVPAEHMKDEIMYCGTKSGKDVDKFSALNLGTLDGRQVLSPVIDIAGTHFECRIVYKSAMDPEFMVTEFEKLYPEKDYHTLYFGEIVACYKTD